MKNYDKEIKNFASFLFSLSSFDFVLCATIIGYILSYPLTIDEQNSLGNFIELIGQIMLTFNAQNQTLQNDYAKKMNAKRLDLKAQIDELRLEIEKIKQLL